MRTNLPLLALIAVLVGVPLAAQTAPSPSPRQIQLVTDGTGTRLQVDGRDFLVKGVNWDYFPVGQTVSYSLWTQDDDVIRAALDREMSLLRAMGVNAIRQYNGVPPRWVRYIYEHYGIWTVLNHPFGRYGTTVGGVYTAQTDYSDPRVRASLVKEMTQLVDEFRGTPGVLMWIIGNENNYAFQWKSAATENLPKDQRDTAKARVFYSLVGEAARAIKAHDASQHPVAMANGDLNYLDVIAQEAKGVDVFGTNVYRGRSFGTLFSDVQQRLGLPVMFTEFGADAWNAREMREDQLMQARYVTAQWEEIYENTAGHGRVGNAIGGFTFQWSDGWWKDGQDVRLDQHDVAASWANAAYAEDYVKGENNMNEEWWGIVAKGPTDMHGQFELYPRAAYYALQKAYTLDPYAPGVDTTAIRAHFATIDATQMVLAARATGAPSGDALSPVRVSGMRIELQTFSTGGTHLSTPESDAANPTARPSFQGFDRLESFYVDFTSHPVETFTAYLSVNVLGHVPANPIDEIFYEDRGRARTVIADGAPLTVTSNERLKVYRASVAWDQPNFHVDAFYRTGHYHWGYEGDFFGLYREANYGRATDIYNSDTPIGVEFTGKRRFDGLKVAFGPELWWGANPAVLVKYRRQLPGVTVTGMYQEDLAQLTAAQVTSSFAIPQPKTRKATLSALTSIGRLGVELGGIWSGQPRVGEHFQVFENGRALSDSVRMSDTFGAKLRTTMTVGRYSWYAQGAAMGLVAEAGPTQIQTYTGWWLRDVGTGNQWNVMTGVSAIYGAFQVAPNVLYQKPIVGPIPFGAPPPAVPRNVIDDPFYVRYNREMAAGELLLTWDPTPGTWMYAWDSDLREDASLAASLAYTYRHLPTTMDAAIGFLADGRTPFAFPGAPPPHDLWEVRGRVVGRPMQGVRLIANLWGGTAQANGSDPRLLHRYGGDVRAVRKQVMLIGGARFNDWGPYDYHRDFNLTFPQQFMADASTTFGTVQWFDLPATRLGIRGTWRSLDKYSPRYCPAMVPDNNGVPVCDPTYPGERGSEWEIRTYLMVAW